jgi:hypothetical protein
MATKERKDRPLAPAELAAHRAALAGASGRRRLDLVLGARDPQALVRALPAEDLYLAIREIGLADAAPLVQLASADQFKHFLDLDAWRGDSLDPARALAWLRAARAGALDDPRAAARWARKVASMDPEVLFLALRSSLRVHDLEDDDDPLIEGDRFERTPDNKFVVEYTVDGAEYAAVKGILDDLFAEDAFMATRLLSALRWELDSELTETAWRWRAGRLADLGFPTLDEALSWFAKPAPGAPVEPAGLPERPPGFWLAAHPATGLLARAGARLGDEDRDALEPQVAAAANAVVVADSVDPGDPDAVAGALAAARALVELGLEARAGSDDVRAAEELASVPLKRLFQEGFGRVLELKWRAEKLRKKLATGKGAQTALVTPLGEALTALASKRPRFHTGLEVDRARWGDPALGAFPSRPFLSSLDLTRTAAALDAIEGLLSADETP